MLMRLSCTKRERGSINRTLGVKIGRRNKFICTIVSHLNDRSFAVELCETFAAGGAMAMIMGHLKHSAC